jgi:hypothetical protein
MKASVPARLSLTAKKAEPTPRKDNLKKTTA